MQARLQAPLLQVPASPLQPRQRTPVDSSVISPLAIFESQPNQLMPLKIPEQVDHLPATRCANAPLTPIAGV
jgi:hypothetical protein